MPLYDYQCKQCGKTFEVPQGIHDEKLTTCPESICPNKGEVVRKIGAAGVILTGKGFYGTDYKKGQ